MKCLKAKGHFLKEYVSVSATQDVQGSDYSDSYDLVGIETSLQEVILHWAWQINKQNCSPS
jgi:hypothetical protein